MPFRLLSWNVRYFGHGTKGLASTRKDVEASARALASLEEPPAILCLQEVEATSLRAMLTLDRAAPWSLQLDLFEKELEAALARAGRAVRYQPVYFFAHAHRFGRRKLASMGLGVLVDTDRFEIESHNGAAPAPVTHAFLKLLERRKQKRICAHLKLRDRAGRPLHVFNTHLSLPTPFTRAFWRGRRLGHGPNQLAEAQKLLAQVRARAGDEPFVLAGDFNAPPATPVFRALTEAGLTSAQVACGQIDGRSPDAFSTAGFFTLRMHLDHVFTGGGARALDVEGTLPFGDRASPFRGCSDHSPILARVDC